MKQATIEASIGGLLHDIGKVIYRKGIEKLKHSKLGYDFLIEQQKNISKNILDCVRYHHADEISSAKLLSDSPAYAVYIGDNIASGADRRDSDDEKKYGYDMNIPLSSVFGTMQGKENVFAYKAQVLDEKNIIYPQNKSEIHNSSENYSKISEYLSHELKAIEYNEEYLNSLLSIMECCTSYVPSTTAVSQVQDISLFDHMKLTAAFAACITEYCIANGITDFKKELFKNSSDFYQKKVFLMYSCDISGIQKFIYNISTEFALKSLRSRSFALEILMEHHIDELLDVVGMSRANLIYSGGGHCYIILPNTEKALQACKENEKCMRSWLINNYGTSLYFASAVEPCSGNDLMNIPIEKNPYSNIYRELSRKISEKKLHRYSADEIRMLNSIENGGNTRECKVCGKSQIIKDKDYCKSCDMFIQLGKILIKPNLKIVVTKSKLDNDNNVYWELPSVNGTVFLNFISDDSEKNNKIRSLIASHDDIVRIYTKNKACTGFKYARNIYMGDYCYNKDLNSLINDIPESQKEIKRIAVLRADVDNLGKAFISGFEYKNSDNPKIRYKNVTISRTASFSRQMSMFFRFFINRVLSGNGDISGFKLNNDSSTKKKVNIVYSGGDDVFLVGLWSDVIEAASDIRRAFEKYCNSALTISAGIGIFAVKYPIAVSAKVTEELEDNAKSYKDDSGKEKMQLIFFRRKTSTFFHGKTLKILLFKKNMQKYRNSLIIKKIKMKKIKTAVMRLEVRQRFTEYSNFSKLPTTK